MSLTGQLQAIGSRGYSLLWSITPLDRPDYATLVLDILDRAGVIVASDRRPTKASGSVITKDGEAVQRAAQIAWAEELTRNPLFLPQSRSGDPGETPDSGTAEETIHTEEERANGEALSPLVPDLNAVEAQADHPV